MHLMSIMKTLAACVLFTGLLGATDADALVAVNNENNVQNPSGTCRGATSASEADLTFTATAVEVSGLSTTSLICTPTTDYSATTLSLQVAFYNSGSTTASINCTAIFGPENSPALLYITKSVSIAPGAGNAITWTKADNGNVQLTGGPVSYQCAMPPSTRMRAAVTTTTKNMTVM
jgi:acyl-coenzyme A thioesterase PaaI-like protein